MSPDAFNLVTASGRGTRNVSIPAINAGGLNAASYALSAPVAASSIATVFGSFPVGASISASVLPLPPILAGLSLKFADGFPVPLLFVSGSQVNIQVPWELTGQSEASDRRRSAKRPACHDYDPSASNHRKRYC